MFLLSRYVRTRYVIHHVRMCTKSPIQARPAAVSCSSSKGSSIWESSKLKWALATSYSLMLKCLTWFSACLVRPFGPLALNSHGASFVAIMDPAVLCFIEALDLLTPPSTLKFDSTIAFTLRSVIIIAAITANSAASGVWLFTASQYLVVRWWKNNLMMWWLHVWKNKNSEFLSGTVPHHTAFGFESHRTCCKVGLGRHLESRWCEAGMLHNNQFDIFFTIVPHLMFTWDKRTKKSFTHDILRRKEIRNFAFFIIFLGTVRWGSNIWQAFFRKSKS